MNLKGNLTSKGLQGSIGKSRMQGILGTNPAAIPITVDNALSLSSTNPVQNRVITAAITNRLWSDEVKTALLQIVEKVAFIDEHGQDYYDALYDALYPPVGLDSIGAVFDSSATIYTTDTLDDLKQYLTVTAYYTSGDSEVVTTYTLSGSMDAGTQTITVAYGGKTTTFTVTIVALEVESIDAVFTQSGTIYTTDTLDTLKQYLTVTATYSDTTTAVVTDYTLSGTLGEGTRTITASYGGKSDTFTVACTVNGWLYHFEQSLASSGSEDFGFDGVEEYTTSVTGYAYYHNVPDSSSANDPLGIKATGLTKKPDLSGDFTISLWHKATTALRGHLLCASKYSGASGNASNLPNVTDVASGWTVSRDAASKAMPGFQILFSSQKLVFRIMSTSNTYGSKYTVTLPSTIDTTQWHHYALARSDGSIRFFFDGSVIFTIPTVTNVAFANQVAIGNIFGEASGTKSDLVATAYGDIVDDVYIAEFCKWTAAFDPSTIVY